MTAARRAVAHTLTAAAVIGASAVVWHHLPTRTEVYAPFPVAGSLGAPARGRAITATVSGVQIAPTLQIRAESFRSTSVAAIGQWLVLSTDMRSGDRPERARAELRVGADTYLPTDRLPPWASMNDTLEPGFVTRGAWVFDVSPEVLDGRPITLRAWAGDGFLDSRLDIGIDLHDPRVVRSDVASLSATQIVVS